MQVRLVQLFHDGTRRPREQCLADPGLVGMLTLEIVTQNLVERRPVRMAAVWEKWGSSSRRKLTAPLFDAELLRITHKGLWLRGHQIDSAGGRRVLFVQEWWCEVKGE